MIRVVGWGSALLVVVLAALAWLAVALDSADRNCAARGGHEVFQGYASARQAVVMVPVYRCEGAR